MNNDVTKIHILRGKESTLQTTEVRSGDGLRLASLSRSMMSLGTLAFSEVLELEEESEAQSCASHVFCR